MHIKEQEKFNVSEIKTFFLQEMFKRGILIIGSHNISFSHKKEDIDQLILVYSEVLPMIKRSVKDGSLLIKIDGDILQPLFKVR